MPLKKDASFSIRETFNHMQQISYSPVVCMDPAVHYTTQSSAYDRLLVGKRLTNRIIAQRQREGYYEKGGILFKMKERTKKKGLVKRAVKEKNLDTLLKDFEL